MPSEPTGSSVDFEKVDSQYFQQRELKKGAAGWVLLVGLGVAYVISGDYAGWNFGLGAGVWSRNGNTAYKVGRAVQAGRVWTNCYHLYPAHAAFGGYKKSGIGRENHQMALNNYQQTKNLLVSYSENKLGFF